MHSHIGGFESTHIFGSGQDILGSTRHIEHWCDDLYRLLEQGITTLRYSAPWHRIERQRGFYEWDWFDGPMEFMRAHDIAPILDPLHHTSFPAWLTSGFLNPNFPQLYVQFLRALCTRYPWVTRYTVFNEPLPTTLFCSYTGMWYPHCASDRTFVRMLMQVGRAICSGCHSLKALVPATFVHVETCEHHQAMDESSSGWCSFVNARRFLVTDLILGRITGDHGLYPYMLNHGATDSELAWFEDNPAHIDVLGLDYYVHSEMDWAWSHEKARSDITPAVKRPRGFASIARDYVARYGLPIMLSETNIVGTVKERISWLKWMEAECERLGVSGVDVNGFCWYPSIDTTDWSNGCTRYTGQIDSQGIWSLDEGTLARIDTELSDIYGRLARGKMTAADIPGYGFGDDLSRRLHGYKHA